MYYYIGYLIISFIGGLRLVRRDTCTHPFLLLFFAATIFLFGFRYGIGTDYHSYIGIFEDIEAGRGFHKNRLEFGYYWANYGLAQLGMPAQSIIFFSYLVTLSLIIFTARRYSDNLFISILVLVCFGLLFKSTNVVRQCLAFSLCLLAIPYILRRDFLRFLLTVSLAAFLFHRTALFFVGAYFVYSIPRSQLLWFLLFLLAVFIKVAHKQLIGTLASVLSGLDFVYAGYFIDMQQIQRSATGLGINLLLELGLFFFIVANLPNIKDDGKSRLFLSVYMIGILLNFAFSGSAMFTRATYYYYDFAFLALPVVVQSIKPGPGRAVFYCLFLAYCVMLYVNSAFSDDSQYQNYGNVLLGAGEPSLD
jgi:hypothetical protein